MPFPLAELIWDYQVIDDDGVEQEILAFAVKPEVAESFCEKLVELGLSPIQITPAPILDYNALRATGIGLMKANPWLSIWGQSPPIFFSLIQPGF